MSNNDAPRLDVLRALIDGRFELISRIAAPLWSRAGKAVARALLGETGPDLLFNSLCAFEAIEHGTNVLNPIALCAFISGLFGRERSTNLASASAPTLVWTLPDCHPAQTTRGRSYQESCLRLINEAAVNLILVAPFVDPPGIGILMGPLLGALDRGVRVKLFVHDALNLANSTSRALEQLRRDAERVKGDLSVYSAEAGAGRDRILNPLFHAKLIISDDRELLLGSANLTSYALSANFEAGVLLEQNAAKEASFILEGILQSRAVYLVFQTTSSLLPSTFVPPDVSNI